MGQDKSKNLEIRIRRDLDFLFSQEGATFRNCATDSRGNVEAEVQASKVAFQFAWNIRDGEDRVMVAPSDGRGVWELIHVALAASTGEDVRSLSVPFSNTDDPGTVSYVGLSRLRSFLLPRFAQLNDAFAPKSYAATRLRMAHIERELKK
jgi:hypothetical protein